MGRALTETQRIVLALTRATCGSISLLASLIIIRKVYLRYKKKKSDASNVRTGRNCSNNAGINTYYRMLFCTSVLDVFHSFWSALGVVATPPSAGGVFSRGTVATCTTSGLFLQTGTPIVLYMAILNIYFMLKIRYNIPDSVIEKRYEFWFHAIPITFWLITGTLGIYWEIFNAIGLPELGCWVAPYPRGCAATDTCTRGHHIAQYLDWYAWSFSYMGLFISAIVTFATSILIYTAIWKQEKRNEKYLANLQTEGGSSQGTPGSSSMPINEFGFMSDFASASQEITNLKQDVSNHKPENLNQEGVDDESLKKEALNSNVDVSNTQSTQAMETNVPETSASFSFRNARAKSKNIKNSRIAAVQGCLYSFSALFTAVWVFLPWVGYKLQVEAPTRFFFAFMLCLLAGSQGTFNLFIFVRVQYLRLREQNGEWTRLMCIRQCLLSSE